MTDRRLNLALAALIAFGGLILASMLTVNIVQARQTGCGSGFGDTRELTPEQAQTFFAAGHPAVRCRPAP